MTQKIKHKTKKGFSIGEVLVSAFVLVVGVVGAMVLIINNLTVSHDSRDTIIAAQLAQEGVELVRNIRDDNVAVNQDKIGDTDFNPLGALSGVVHPGTPTGGPYKVDYESDLRSEGSNYGLQYNGFFYEHVASSTTEFQRRIFIIYKTAGTATNDYTDDSAEVLSFVTWGGKSVAGMDKISDCIISEKCSVATTTLTSWFGHS